MHRMRTAVVLGFTLVMGSLEGFTAHAQTLIQNMQANYKGCSTWHWDANDTNGKCGYNQTFNFQGKLTSFSPSSTFAKTTNTQVGFSVSVTVGLGGSKPSGLTSLTYQHVVTIYGGQQEIPLVTLFRRSDGVLYLIRALSSNNPYDVGTAAPAYNATQLWDPIGACNGATTFRNGVYPYGKANQQITDCTETIVLNFQANGQLRVDDIARAFSGGSTEQLLAENWQSGLLNYGFPVASFADGDSPTAAINYVQPTDVYIGTQPESTGNMYVTSGLLDPSQAYLYPAGNFGAVGSAPILQIALWNNGFLSEAQVAAFDQLTIAQEQYPVPATTKRLSSTSLPCNTGAFEKGFPGDTYQTSTSSIYKTTTYDPNDISSVCNN